MSPRALLLLGAGPTADPWHDFAGTGERASAALGAAGFSVEVDTDVLGRLADGPEAEVVVLNFGAGLPEDRDAEAQARAAEGFARYLDGGGGAVALHATLTAMTEVPEWTTLLGGRWIEGIAMHPPFGPADVDVATDRHRITAGIPSFGTEDERYSFLDMAPGSTVLASHRLEGFPHPLVWTAGRVAVIALGHAPMSWDAPEAPRLLQQAARWAAGD